MLLQSENFQQRPRILKYFLCYNTIKNSWYPRNLRTIKHTNKCNEPTMQYDAKKAENPIIAWFKNRQRLEIQTSMIRK